MSSTRYRQQPLQIYQDPVSYDHAPMPSLQSSTAKSSSPLRPVKNASSRRNVVFNPPATSSSNPSPLKSAQQTSSSPLRAPLGNKLNMVAMPPPGGPNFQTDSMEKKQPTMSSFKTGSQKPFFSTFATQQPSGKENCPTPIYPAPTHYNEAAVQRNFSVDGIYGQKASNKRVLMDSAPIQESRQSKKTKLEKEPEASMISAPHVPAPEQFPPLRDDGTKPAHSYAMLIGMAILRTPNRRLTLAQIYKWISDTYSYYNTADAGWQNSIRHNLSLNKAFIKQERPKDDPGKGNYWAIEAGMEQQFIKEKQSKKPTGLTLENGPILSTTLAPAPSYRHMTPAPQELPPSSSFMPSEPVAPAGADLSSDATIPASDLYLPEEEQEDDQYLAPTSSRPIQSSPPPMMHSSPPVVHHTLRQDDTPPPVPRFSTSSRTRSHKRNFASMDDSGYFSSINSSVIRGQHGERQLTSEADRPRKGHKRGRAEEEIARLRGSSYDSPTKAPTFRNSISFAPPSSSPIRRGLKYDTSQMLPPLTPAVKLRAPLRPPPSVSPNTNLRMHRDRVRQLVGSPDRGLTCLEENVPWSPAFQIDQTDSTSYLNLDADFDSFNDIDANFFMVPGNGSPEKRSAKRPRMDRAHSTSILSDITNTNHKSINITSTPMMKLAPTLAPPFDSPSKQLIQGSPLKFNSPSLSLSGFELAQEDFCAAEFLTDELTEFSGMDIMQGFQKIGAGQGGQRGNTSRPGVGRSFSTRF